MPTETVYIGEEYADTTDADLWYGGPGWYYVDEIQMYVGPYDSQELATKALQDYIYNL